MTQLKVSPVPAQLSDDDKKKEYRYEVEFIFGTAACRIINLKNNLCKDLPLGSLVTERTFCEEFERVCAAMIEAGMVHPEDRVLCTTVPEGSRRIEAGGTA